MILRKISTVSLIFVVALYTGCINAPTSSQVPEYSPSITVSQPPTTMKSTAPAQMEEKSLPPVFSSMDRMSGRYYSTLCFADNSSSLVFSRLPTQLDAEFAELTLNTELPTEPETLIAYKVTRPEVDESFAHNLAQRVGFNDPPKFYTADKTYRVYNGDPSNDNSPVFFIYQEGSFVIYYTRNIYKKSLSLPSDRECIEIAKKWLESHNLYPTNVIKITTAPVIVSVVGKPESQNATGTWVSFFVGLGGYELFGMGAHLLIGENGEIRKVLINTSEFEPYTSVKIQKPDLALGTFQDYLRNPSKFGNATPECLTRDINRYVSIDSISLKYLAMFNPEDGQPAYAQPIYIFEGKGRNKPELGWDDFMGACDAVSR